MKRILSLLLTALMLTGTLAGCNTPPAETPDTTDGAAAETTPAETTPTETEPPKEEIPAYNLPVTAEYDGYTVTLSAPVVVSRGNVGDDSWGHNQFPNIRKTKEGWLFASWAYGDDIVGAKNNISFNKISLNGGKSWSPNPAGYGPTRENRRMPNGKCFVSFRSAGTVTAQEIVDTHTPAVNCDDGKRLFFAEDLSEDPVAIEKRITALAFNEYDPETGETTVVECTLNWPYAPVSLYSGGLFYTVSGFFGLSGTNVIVASDGTLYTCIYCTGFDSTASSREEAITAHTKRGKSSVYVFSSEDSGRTWNFIAQKMPGEEVEDHYDPGFEGYDEPKMIEMPDGSLLMLMRSGGTTTDYCPMYVTRSTDKGQTWTTPEVFDYCGVLPQLLRLENGVTIASYGRPDLLIRTTDDPAGLDWDEHVEVPLSNNGKNYMMRSCFYTNMLALDENTAILIYSDFQYPDKNGDPRKTILTRTITVTPNE